MTELQVTFGYALPKNRLRYARRVVISLENLDRDFQMRV
jgi:hypothetical protein